MTKIEQLLTQIENQIPFFETTNTEISKASVGWHIEHTLLTLNGIANSLIKSNPKNYKWRFNFMRMIVFTTKKIPRGKAKAPKVVQPTSDIDQNSLQVHLTASQNKIKELNTLPKDKYFEHPFFGKLKLPQTITFLEIHSNHHLQIMNDILKK